MKIEMQSCTHRQIEKYDFEPDLMRGTCMACYTRLIVTADADTWQPDRPVMVICAHAEKKAIARDPKFKSGPWYDAMCMTCGTVLRHPDGPGGWAEVVFSGYVIPEEP